ncbi:MAG: cupin domain-containing protein [Chloroflexota bacterium]|nr:cupin domain-containing protein [Chloroflexota bacterium]
MATSTAGRVRLITPDQHTQQTAQTAGFLRQEIVTAPGVWIGITRTPPGSTSAWHHHGDYDTYIYLQDGNGRMEFGPRGAESCDASVGDVLFVPKGAIHRESNTGSGENAALIVRVGTGEPVFNVAGPED